MFYSHASDFRVVLGFGSPDEMSNIEGECLEREWCCRRDHSLRVRQNILMPLGAILGVSLGRSHGFLQETLRASQPALMGWFREW